MEGFRVAGLVFWVWGLGFRVRSTGFEVQDFVVSQNRGPQYRPQNTIVLIIGTPKMVPLILGNPHLGFRVRVLGCRV